MSLPPSSHSRASAGGAAENSMPDEETPESNRQTRGRLGWLSSKGYSYFLGLGGGIALIFYMVRQSAAAGTYINPDGLLIVGGGVTIVALISFTGSDIWRALAAAFSVTGRASMAHEAVAIVEVARRLRRDIHQAEEYVQTIPNLFLRTGLQMVVDGVPLDDMMHVLSWRIEKDAESENIRARLFRSLASCAPAFGLLGTIIGMVAMLGNLASGDLPRVGSGMAVAMLSTFYGLLLANMIFKPIAIKLEQKTRARVAEANLMLEAIALVRLGRSPSMIAETLDVLGEDERDGKSTSAA